MKMKCEHRDIHIQRCKYSFVLQPNCVVRSDRRVCYSAIIYVVLKYNDVEVRCQILAWINSWFFLLQYKARKSEIAEILWILELFTRLFGKVHNGKIKMPKIWTFWEHDLIVDGLFFELYPFTLHKIVESTNGNWLQIHVFHITPFKQYKISA